MIYSLIDDWIKDFCDTNNYEEKDSLVDVFPQAIAKNGKMKNIEVTIVREKNFETADIFFDEEYMYTVYDPNEMFMKDFLNHELKDYERDY